MSTLEDKIAALEAELAQYATMSITDRLISTTAALITAKENRLTELLRAQNAAASSAAFTGVEGWQFYSVILF
jgi:hypothetical protein